MHDQHDAQLERTAHVSVSMSLSERKKNSVLLVPFWLVNWKYPARSMSDVEVPDTE
jgi:hypothetical protein